MFLSFVQYQDKKSTAVYHTTMKTVARHEQGMLFMFGKDEEGNEYHVFLDQETLQLLNSVNQ